MNDTTDVRLFQQDIERRIEKTQAALQAGRQRLAERMTDLEELEQQFNRRAHQLCQDVIRPRTEAFVSYFENAQLDVAGPAPRIHSEFRHCERFPVQASIEFDVGRSSTIQDAFSIRYHADIIPLFIKFDHDDEYRTPIDTPHTDPLGKWVEQKLLGFLDSYLQIETHEQYQRLSVEIDPVCGMPVAKAVGLTHAFGGKTYYFCTQHCVDQFAARPEQFLKHNVNDR